MRGKLTDGRICYGAIFADLKEEEIMYFKDENPLDGMWIKNGKIYGEI